MLSYNIDIEIMSGADSETLKGYAVKSEDNISKDGNVSDVSGRLDLTMRDSDGASVTLRFVRKDLADILRFIDGVQV